MSESAYKESAAVAREAQRLTNRRSLYIVAAFGIYALDQLSKVWAAARLQFGGDMEIIPGFFSFVYAENTGIAFGQFQRGGNVGRWLLTSFALAAAVGVAVYFFRTPPRNHARILGACALLFAGIIGNLTDRLRLGYVIDFILLYVQDFHWPIFNVADASICAGALLLAIDAIFDSGDTSQRSEGQNVENL